MANKEDKWLIAKISGCVLIFTLFLSNFPLMDYFDYQTRKEVIAVVLKKDYGNSTNIRDCLVLMYNNKKYSVPFLTKYLDELSIGDTISVFYSQKTSRMWSKEWNVSYQLFESCLLNLIPIFGIFYNIIIVRLKKN